MNENTIPALDQFAITDWSENDVMSLVNQEDNTPSVKEVVQTPTPAIQTSSQPVVQTDTYNQELKQVLQEELNDVSINQQPQVTLTEAQKQELRHQSQTQQQVQQELPQGVFSTAFEIMADLDLIRIPDNFDVSTLTEEDLIMLKEETLAQQYQEAYDAVRQDIAHDPYMLDLVDYALQGGSFASLPKMISLMQKEIDYRTLNLNEESVQKELVRRYLSNGLNSNDPKDMKLLEFIPEKINSLVKNKTLRTEAETARNYFLGIQEKAKQQEFQRVLQEQEYARQNEERQIQVQEDWNREFSNSLTKKNWTTEKKEAVKRENEFVQLQDGTQLPMWQYKQQVIFSNPDLFQYFLDFTSTFDPQTKQFKGLGATKEKEQSSVNRLLQNLKNKNQNTMRTNQNFNQNPAGEKKPLIADPTQDWF